MKTRNITRRQARQVRNQKTEKIEGERERAKEGKTKTNKKTREFTRLIKKERKLSAEHPHLGWIPPLFLLPPTLRSLSFSIFMFVSSCSVPLQYCASLHSHDLADCMAGGAPGGVGGFPLAGPLAGPPKRIRQIRQNFDPKNVGYP
jgi:hypothetical protein